MHRRKDNKLRQAASMTEAEAFSLLQSQLRKLKLRSGDLASWPLPWYWLHSNLPVLITIHVGYIKHGIGARCYWDSHVGDIACMNQMVLTKVDAGVGVVCSAVGG